MTFNIEKNITPEDKERIIKAIELITGEDSVIAYEGPFNCFSETEISFRLSELMNNYDDFRSELRDEYFCEIMNSIECEDMLDFERIDNLIQEKINKINTEKENNS